jgi:hypothetical protein
MMDDMESREPLVRYSADRICLWRLCGNGACLRARACKGDVYSCVERLHGWLEAVEAEWARLPALENALETIEQVKVHRAWRKMVGRVLKGEHEDSVETLRLRKQLARQIDAMVAYEQSRKA